MGRISLGRMYTARTIREMALPFSRSTHWAFDRGIFRISDQYEVVVNPKIADASTDKFPVIEMDRKKIMLPKDQYYWPHSEALA